MELNYVNKDLNNLFKYKNYAVFISISSITINLVLILLLAFKTETLVLIPADLSQPVEVSTKGVHSSAYLEEWSKFLLHFKLDVTPANYKSQLNVFLKYLDSKYYHDFLKQTNEDYQSYQHLNIVTSFLPRKFLIDQDHLKVFIIGDLTINTSVGSNLEQDTGFEIDYVSKRGKLFTKNFKKLTKAEIEAIKERAK